MRKRRRLSRALSWCNGEVLLRWWANCGTVIAVRAVWSSLFLSTIALAVSNAVDPKSVWGWSGDVLHTQVHAGLPWFATSLAASYAAFYTRFASQWAYAAELYNAIKAAECEAADPHSEPLAEWKAGFMEDCHDLHLARKPSFATTILAWGEDPTVRRMFSLHAVGGEARLVTLLCIASEEAERPLPEIGTRASAPEKSEAEHSRG